MGLATKWGKFLVNSNVFIALAALTFTAQTYFIHQYRPQGYYLMALVFAATLIVYNAHRMLSLPTKNYVQQSDMHEWMQRNLWVVYGLLALAALAGAYCFLKVNRTAQLTLILLGVLSVFYALPLRLPTVARLRLRDIGVVKPFLIGIVWAIATAFLPLTEMGAPAGEMAITVVARALFITALCIPFDVRDMRFDNGRIKYPTIPMRWGINRAKGISLLLLMGFLFLVEYREFIMFSTDHPAVGFAMFLSFTATAWLLAGVREYRQEYYYTFWIDGMMILQFLLIVFSKFIYCWWLGGDCVALFFKYDYCTLPY